MYNFVEIFTSVLGEPDDMNMLVEYCEFVQSKETDTDLCYCEVHHLLPKCVFQEYRLDKRNLFRLTYDDHATAHKMLYAAYNIPKFGYSLYCFDPTFKHKSPDEVFTILSELRKLDWIKLKLDDNAFQKWKNSELRKPWCESSENLENLYAYTLLNAKDPVINELRSKHTTMMWKDDTYRETQILKYRITMSDPVWRIAKSKSCQECWDNKTPEQRENFRKTMTEVNRREEKKQSAGNAIRNLWATNEDYKNKMKNRAKPKTTNSSKMKEKWNDPEWREKTLRSRKEKREAKNREKERENKTNN